MATVIVNWNGLEHTTECIRSLAALTYPDLQVIVVDNASTDGSPQAIRDRFPNVVVLQANANLGFAGGCNLGIRHAIATGAEYVWLLNNDTVVRADALDRLVEAAEAHDDRDFFGSWIVFQARPDTLWFGGGRYDGLTGRIKHEDYGRRVATCEARGQVTPTAWISACSLLFRSSAVRRVGLLDESFFLYREELDWQLRANRKHPRALLVREPLVQHKVGGSTGTSESELGKLFMARNQLKLMRRHAGAAWPIWLVRWCLRYVYKPALKGDLRSVRTAFAAVRLQSAPGEAILQKIRAPAPSRPSG